MGSIDVKALIGDIDTYIKSSAGQKEIDQICDAAVLDGVDLPKGQHTIVEAAEKFIDVLDDTIEDSSLSENAKAAVNAFTYDKPEKIGRRRYLVVVKPTRDLHRASLYEKGYPEGIDHLDELLNDGVDHTMKRVYGTWHDKRIASRTVIDGANYMEEAVSSYMSGYASDYNVEDVEIRREGT